MKKTPDKEDIKETRTERKKQETKEIIISVAMNLFRKQGFSATSMEQIANEVDIAKGTLYNYFPVKEAILSEFMQQSFREKFPERILQLRKMPDTRTRMISLITELVTGIKSQKEIFEKYMIYRIQKMISLEEEDNIKSGLYLLEIEIIELGQKSGEIRDDLPIYILTDLFEFVFIEVVKRFYTASEKIHESELIAKYVELFLNGATNNLRNNS